MSFNTSKSWSDIYSFRPGHRAFIKSDFYEGGSFSSRGVRSMAMERNVDAHAKMRRHLSHAFSAQSLAEQEVLVTENIDKFVELVGREGTQGDCGINMSKAFAMMTFDVIADLAFGESFGGLESGEQHPWIAVSLGALKVFPLIDAFKRFPLVGALFTSLMPAMIEKITQETLQNEEFSIEIVKKYVEISFEPRRLISSPWDTSDALHCTG